MGRILKVPEIIVLLIIWGLTLGIYWLWSLPAFVMRWVTMWCDARLTALFTEFGE